MTMRVIIKNDDAHRSLRVTPVDAEPGETVEAGRETIYSQTLRPGESCDAYAHSSQVILLEEIPL
jgi:hypothetical protein